MHKFSVLLFWWYAKKFAQNDCRCATFTLQLLRQNDLILFR